MIKQVKTIRNFWITFFAILTVLFLATSIYIFVTLSQKMADLQATTISDENYYKTSAENNFHQALFEAVDNLKNIDASLSKAVVSNNSANQAEHLVSTAAFAVSLNTDISRLPVSQGDLIEKIETYTNHLTNYSKALVKKLTNGEPLNAADKACLQSLDATTQGFYNGLKEILDENGGMFVTNSLFGNGSNTVGDGISDMDESIFNYEKLIYDGPFSDSRKEQEIAVAKKITQKQGESVVAEIFASENVQSVEYVTTINNKGTLYTYNIETENGTIRAMLAVDGRLVEFDFYQENADGQSTEQGLEGSMCLEIAENFAQKLGFDVKGIWVSKSQETVTYVNLAPVVDDVIIYPDLIKVAVDSNSGHVVGFEARAYLMNNKERDLTFGEYTEEDLSDNFSAMTIVSVNKALINKNDKEYTCFEFECQMGDSQYFVYMDSKTGEELEIFKVIKGTEGYTVM